MIRVGRLEQLDHHRHGQRIAKMSQSSGDSYIVHFIFLAELGNQVRNRPDDTDTGYSKLRGELAKYNPAPGGGAIIAELELP